MIRLFRILVRIFAGLLVLTCLAALLVYYLLAQSIPDYNRSFEVRGIDGRVEIIRDNHAIPHIFAEAEHDIYFGLGFAHAQDRLWQMLMFRRTVQGRLSELFGEDTLSVDRFMRNLDIYGVAQASVGYQDPEAMRILEAYSRGVNARIAAIRQEALGRGAPELFLFEPDIAPWTPADTLGIMRLLALQLTDKAAMEVLQARLALAVDRERVNDLFPVEQGAPIMALPEFASFFDDPPPGGDVEYARHPLLPLPEPGFGGASNAFAASASRSANNGTLLATDPHLRLSAPGIWMLARLEFPEGGSIGGTIPGLPAILVGRNGEFGWGFTASYLDDQDIFIDKINPGNADEYVTPKGFRPFETRKVIISVKDQPGVTETFRRTAHGPVIDDGQWGVDAILPPGHVASLAWTALDPDDASLNAMVNLMRARTVDAAREVIRDLSSPSLNLVMADTTSIAIQTAGRAPRRSPAHTSQGRIPAAGWLEQNAWDGYLPFEDNPYVEDPASGIVVNTNNRLTDAAFPNHWSFDWGDEQRILRAERMLNGREFHTLDSFIEIQTDTVSPAARTLVPLIARDLWFTGNPAPEGTPEWLRQRALGLLADWNGEMSEHDAEPLIYAAWLQALQQRLMIDEVGQISKSLTRLRPLFIERVFRDVDGAGVWCDVRQTGRVEDCTEMARLALDEALLNLTRDYGDRIESWRWGNAHQAYHKHEVLGSIPLLSWFVNIRQDTPGGDNTLLRGTLIGAGEEPYLNVSAAGFRAVYDFADPESSVFVIATGQSGHFLSRHYDDLAQIWRRSEYIPMTLDPILARGGSLGITVLEPLPDE